LDNWIISQLNLFNRTFASASASVFAFASFTFNFILLSCLVIGHWSLVISQSVHADLAIDCAPLALLSLNPEISGLRPELLIFAPLGLGCFVI
jgi:hypothetical protein